MIELKPHEVINILNEKIDTCVTINMSRKHSLFGFSDFDRAINVSGNPLRTKPSFLDKSALSFPFIVIINDLSQLEKFKYYVNFQPSEIFYCFINELVDKYPQLLSENATDETKAFYKKANELYRKTEKIWKIEDPPIEIIPDKLYFGSSASKKDPNMTFHVNFRERYRESPSTISDEKSKTYLLDDTNEDFDAFVNALNDIVDLIPTLNNEKILINCTYGMSRSPTAICYILMKLYNYRLKDCWDLVYKARPILAPLKCYVDFLSETELSLLGSQSIVPYKLSTHYKEIIIFPLQNILPTSS